MLVGGQLVLKLPRARVAELLEAGTGAPFASSIGRPMEEWLTVTDPAPDSWRALAGEALEFVGSR